MNEQNGVEVLRAEVAPVVARAQALTIRTPAEYAVAGEGLKEIKGAQKRVKDFFAPMKAANLEATRRTNEACASVLNPLEEAEAIWKQKQTAYTIEQERIRKAEEDRINRENAERDRREREKIEAAARAQREREEAARRAEQEAQARAARAKSEEARQKALAEAEKARREADAAAAKATAKAEAAEAFVPSAPVTLASNVPTVKGQSFLKKTYGRIVDAHAAAAALLGRDDWAAYITINQAELDRFGNRTKGLTPIAGVEWYAHTTLASAGK